MKRLTKIIFVQWYLFDAIEIPIIGHTAVIGGNGAGKSSILDGVQIVLAGGDKNKIALNKGSNERSSRTIKEYCLGVVSDPNGGGKIQPRDKANTYIVLCFRDDETNEQICAGVSIWASATEPKEDFRGLFITKGDPLTLDDFTEETSEGLTDIPWERVKDRLQRRFKLGESLEFPHKGPGDFRRKFYTMMSADPGLPLNSETISKSLLSAIAFNPINDPTKFVRENMLDADDINIRDLRDSLKFWRELKQKAIQTEERIKDLAALEEFCVLVKDDQRDILHHEHASLAARIEKCYETASPAQAELDEIDEDLIKLTKDEIFLTTQKEKTQKELWEREQDLEKQGIRVKIERLEGEQQLVQKENNEIINTLSLSRSECLRLQELKDCGPNIPVEIKAETEKMLKMAEVDGGLLSGLWPENPAAFDAVIQSVLTVARPSLNTIKERTNQLWQRIIPLEEEVGELRSKITRLGKGVSPIGKHTMGLINLLGQNKIVSKPLCDLIDINNERWRNTIEAILGNVREAIIVDPDLAKKAIRIYRNEGKEFRRVHIVNTTKTNEWTGKCQKGSLAELVSTDNPHARAFINLRLGNILCVETESELVTHNRAATADLMLNSGGTITSLDPIDPILGWKNQDDIKKNLQQTLLGKEGELDRHKKNQEKQEIAAGVLQAFINKFENNDGIFVKNSVKRDKIEKRLIEIQAELNLLSQKEDTKLKQLIDGLSSNLKLLETKLEVVKSTITDKRERRGGLKTVIEEQDKLAETLNETIAQIKMNEELDPALTAEILDKLRVKFRDTENFFHTIITDIDSKIAAKRESVRKNEMRTIAGLQEFLSRDSSHALKLGTGEYVFESFEEKRTFIQNEKSRLVETTLAEYSNKADKVLSEVEATFRTKFISKLIEKIARVKENIDGLNKILKKRPFHGETYQFRAIPNAELKVVLDFATAIQDDRFSQNIGGLFDPANDPTSPHYAAIKFINESFQDDLMAKLIQDYRNYYTFNVEIFDNEWNKISDMKHRIAKGSGGENMAPFYVAIGSSLTSAYKIVKRPEGTAIGGMNLAPFDEAFSKLDVANSYNCLEFLKDVGLQVLLAAPDDKYHLLAEQVDTVLWVYRDGADIEIEPEFLKRKARELLSSDNPFIKPLVATGEVERTNADASA